MIAIFVIIVFKGFVYVNIATVVLGALPFKLAPTILFLGFIPIIQRLTVYIPSFICYDKNSYIIFYLISLDKTTG